MINLIPMGGKSSRFFAAGYTSNKTILPVTYWKNGKRYPMALAAIMSIPWINKKNNKLICVNDIEHQSNGLEKKILNHFPNTTFIHDHVKLDQAFGCYLAREFLKDEDELFIGACDNGFLLDIKQFNKLKKTSDVIILSHSNDLNIHKDPDAHSWLRVVNGNSVKNLSFKKTLSKDYTNDHATTGMFWFKSSNLFLNYLERMIKSGLGISKKFYVDQLINIFIQNQKSVKFLDVKYICWGTPSDYEEYELTLKYWKEYLSDHDN